MVKASPVAAARPRAPDAMDVILGMLRHVVVHHMTDVRDVQSARRDVRGDEHFVFAVAKTLQRLFAFLLRAVGMQHADGVIIALERVGDAIRTVLGAAENDDGVVIDAVEQFEQEVGLLRVGYGIDDVLNGFRRRTAGADLDGFGAVHRPLDERLDLRRHGGGEQRGVTRARTFFHETTHIGQETHVQHAVRFIEHEKFHFVQFQCALFKMIQQTSGRGDHDVRAGFQFIVLLAVTNTAEDNSRFQSVKRVKS